MQFICTRDSTKVLKASLCLQWEKIVPKPLQNEKGQKNLGYPRKSSLFPYKRTPFFSGTPIFFGPSYFEAALVIQENFWSSSLEAKNLQKICDP
jgi:hypothetical protein